MFSESFPSLLGQHWQLQYSPTACGTLGKHFTEPVLLVAAPECLCTKFALLNSTLLQPTC